MIDGIIYRVLLMAAFLFGLKTGMNLNKGVSINPLKIVPKVINKVANIKEDKKAKEELDKLNTILSNIENYDGTSKGQKKVGA